ncbi:MAG: DUF2130 domain-containing protein [Candidatus Subteraquimicrobiales bacterium]|nr:DUF2130 domain-containing protein [Candidatus Subteraquimicrobiales bacterium]
MTDSKITCPSCGEEISIDEVFTSQIEIRVKKEFESKQKIKEQEFIAKEMELRKREQDIDKSKKAVEVLVAEKVASQINQEKVGLWKKAQVEADKKKTAEMKILEEQLKQKDLKLSEAQKNELSVRKEKNRLEEEKKEFELEKLRQLDKERKGIIEEADKKAKEESKYVIAQLEKKLNDVSKSNEEMKRKLEQGSQQTQGEVLELELEDVLKAEFPQDEITPVPKGINGADIIQKVCDRGGRFCGQIAWESKKTKTWSEGWIQKLKDDQRAIKAELAVIVSAVLPDNVKGFAFRDGIWICDIKLAVALASALRINLEAVAREKIMSVGKNEKMEILYTYLTGIEFRQKVEAIVEVFSEMQEGLNREKKLIETSWAKREKQIQKVISNTVGMYGDLSELAAMQPIKMLELPKE